MLKLNTATLFILLFLISFVSQSQDVSVMTYNIRLDWGTDENRWENRKELMVNQLKFYEPDILGIQEGLPHQVKYLDSALAEYTYVGVGREDGKQKGEYSAIYFKKVIKMLKSGTFWLSNTPEIVSVGWDAALPRICTYALFKADKKKFWVFNTHFDHVGGEARVESMKLILNQISLLNTQNLPVVLMGDLNVTPDDEPIREMKKDLKDTRDIAEIVYGPDATFNSFAFAQTPQRRIDYIAVDDQVKVMKYAVLTDSYDQRYISDHFPVYCTISFE